jgi:hypothetical protein
MAYVRDRGLAQAPAPVVCETEAPAAAIRGFAFDKYAVPGTERATIEKLAETIRAGRVGNIRLVGHTDSVGTPAYNHILGLDRARAVQQALSRIIGQALDVSLESKGAACPLVRGTSEPVRRQNRRVEVFIAPPRPQPQGCAYDIRRAVEIEMPSARATLEKSAQIAESFVRFVGALSATGRFTKTVLDDKYWFAKLYEYITYYEIEITRSGQLDQPGFVLHFIPVFYDMYADALKKYQSGDRAGVHSLWVAHFSTAGRPRTGSFSDWIGGVVASIKTGVEAHIRGDMAHALEQAYRSYIRKYCLANPPFDRFKRDFFDTMKPVFEKAKAALLLNVSQLGPFPVPPEVGQFILAKGEQTVGGGLSVDRIYAWRAEAWQNAQRSLGQ